MEFDSLLLNSTYSPTPMPKAPKLRPLEDPDEDLSFLQLSPDSSVCSKLSVTDSDTESDFECEPETEHKKTQYSLYLLTPTKSFAKLNCIPIRDCELPSQDCSSLKIKGRSQSCATRRKTYLERHW